MNRTLNIKNLIGTVLALLLVTVPVRGDDTTPDSSPASFLPEATRRAVNNVKPAVVNVRPIIDWDKIPSLDKLIEQRDNDQITKFYENVKSSRLFTGRHRKAMKSLLFRLKSRRDFKAFMEKFRQVLRKPTGQRDVLDFLQYIAPPRTGYSGMILKGGYVLTTSFAVSNEHMTGIKINTAGGKTISGSVRGRYEDFDVALIDIPEEKLPSRARPVSLSDGESRRNTEVGHWAIAIGRGPRPETITSSRGIVSATRLFAGRFLQTDAFCNYSNTGGALVNIQGELIGMIRGVTLQNALFAGLNSGVTRAVKQEAIREVLPRLKKGKEIRSSFLGVQRSRTGNNPERGVRVERVVDGCSAAEAGIQDGDVILSFENKEIFKWRDLVNKIRRHMPGDQITVKVKRDGKTRTFEVKLSSRACMEDG